MANVPWHQVPGSQALSESVAGSPVTHAPIPSPAGEPLPIQPTTQPPGSANTSSEPDRAELAAANTALYGDAKIISAQEDVERPKVISLFSSLFFLTTFVYALLSMGLIAVVVALSIALTNAGTPGFLYLRHYPLIGMLPAVAACATMLFMYIAYKIRDGSMTSWTLAVGALIVFPLTSSFWMPVAASPLVKIVGIYAGSPEKSLFSPSINVQTIGQVFSTFLIFEAILIGLIVTFRLFRFPQKALSSVAKTSLGIIFLLYIVPMFGVIAYGYYASHTTDFEYEKATGRVLYRIYKPRFIPGKRVNSTNFLTNEDLADRYNAIKVTYDLPLPTRVQTGKSSPVTIRQVGIDSTFDLMKYLERLDPQPDNTEHMFLTTALNQQSYLTVHGTTLKLWFVTVDNVLIQISSTEVPRDELLTFAESLR